MSSQRCVLVTGASSGIGLECCRLFAKNGYRVIAAARRRERLNELAAEYPNIKALPLDVKSSTDELEKALDFSKIDILINNAGLALGTEKIDQTPEDQWRDMFETNVLGLIRITQQILPHMIQRKSGDIVNVGSVAGYQTYTGGSIYNATKFAVRALTEAWRKDLLGTGIRVIGIHPGMVETEFSIVRFQGNEEKAKKVYENFRSLKPQDIAESILWAVNCPSHVNIESLLIMPTDQAAVGMLHRS